MRIAHAAWLSAPHRLHYFAMVPPERVYTPAQQEQMRKAREKVMEMVLDVHD